MKRFLLALLGLVSTVACAAVGDGFNDGIDRNAPDFVKASVLIVSPGDELFSCVGHSCIRLECPTFNLDYCFSYESESARERVGTFLSGRLMMGLFAVPTETFLAQYEPEGRGVRQYVLNLPPRVETRLWQLLDEKSAKGTALPYDYIQRGCAKGALDCLKEACAPMKIDGPVLTITQRETFCRELAETHPWTLFFLNALVGTETDTFVDVVTPQNLLDYLKAARLNGAPLLTGEEHELRPQTRVPVVPFLTPRLVSLLVALLLVGMFFVRSRALDWTILTVQALFGAFILYLMTSSRLPTSCWNWLIVPFNFLPLVTWRIRRYWAIPYAVVLGVWVLYMIWVPHTKTDPAYCLLAMGMVFFTQKFVKPQGKGASHE